MSKKKYLVRLTDSERATCNDVIYKLKGTGQKFCRAQMLLKADADGPAWTDARSNKGTPINLPSRFAVRSLRLMVKRKI